MSLIDRLGTEKCDGCGKPFQAKDIVFDGESFLCPTCLELAKKLKDWDKRLEEGLKNENT